MRRRGIIHTALAFAGLIAIAAPVLAQGLPACCVPAAGCCPMKAAAGERKGCCKAPEAPKPDASVRHAPAPVALVAAHAGSAPVVTLSRVAPLETVLTARLEHRAPSPDDSPPDRLSRNHVLLI